MVQPTKEHETKCVSVHTCHTLLARDGGRRAAVSLLADDTGSAPHRWDFSTSIHLHAHPHTHTCKQTHKHTRLPPNDKDQVVHRKHLVIQCRFFFSSIPFSLLSLHLFFSLTWEAFSSASHGVINTLCSLRIRACETSGTLGEEAMGAG